MYAYIANIYICCCCPVAKLCTTVCDPPWSAACQGFPILHYLPEFVQVHSTTYSGILHSAIKKNK